MRAALAGRRRDGRGDQLHAAVAEGFGRTKQSALFSSSLSPGKVIRVLRQGREFAGEFIVGSSAAGLSTRFPTAISGSPSRPPEEPLLRQALTDAACDEVRRFRALCSLRAAECSHFGFQQQRRH